MQVSVLEVVTPQTAQAWLDLANGHNRRPRKSVIRKYALMMSRGQWHEDSGDPIRFDTDTHLIDGQHRLAAVVMSGVTMRFLVIRDINPDVFRVLDSGVPRSNGDLLYQMGASNQHGMASILKVFLAMEGGFSPYNTSALTLVSRDDIADYVEENFDDIQHVANLATTTAAKVRGTVTSWGLFIMLAYKRNDPADVDMFVRSVGEGADLSVGDPRLTLRNWLMRQAQLRRRATISNRIDYAVGIIRAFNAWVDGKTLNAIRLPTEHTFPEVSRHKRHHLPPPTVPPIAIAALGEEYLRTRAK